MNNDRVSLSTTELAAALVLCGYGSMANQILDGLDILTDEESFERFIKQTELTLKKKRYWDENRSVLLVKELENLIDLLVASKRKIRCVRGNDVLFIHRVDRENLLTQLVSNNIHTFSYIPTGEPCDTILKRFLKVKKVSTKKNDFTALLFTSDLFDQIHHLDGESIDNLIISEKMDQELKEFFHDFKRNNFEFDNISLMEMDYMRDFFNMIEVNFFLLNADFIWHLDYEKVENDEIYVVPIEHHDYFVNIRACFNRFLNEEDDYIEDLILNN